jgi:hypothetical protein
MNDKLSDELHLACGLLRPYGGRIRLKNIGWESIDY